MEKKPLQKFERVAICTPTRDSVDGGFAFDLVQLVKENPDSVFLLAKGSIIGNNRTTLVNQAFKQLVSHVLFIDSDMRFKPDLIKKLLAHDVDIVAANCRQRTQDAWTARKGGEFISSEGKTGLEEVETVGFGAMLIKLKVFIDVLTPPYFAMPFDGAKLTGEDVWFCHKAREAGLKIWIDHDVSKDIRHITAIEK